MMLILLRLYGVSYSLTPVVFISAIMHHFSEKCNCFLYFLNIVFSYLQNNSEFLRQQ